MTATPVAVSLAQRSSSDEAIELSEQLIVVGARGGGRRVVDVGRGGRARDSGRAESPGLDPPRCMALPNKCTLITEMKVVCS